MNFEQRLKKDQLEMPKYSMRQDQLKKGKLK
jgi:hypothetical protein